MRNSLCEICTGGTTDASITNCSHITVPEQLGSRVTIMCSEQSNEKCLYDVSYFTELFCSINYLLNCVYLGHQTALGYLDVRIENLRILSNPQRRSHPRCIFLVHGTDPLRFEVNSCQNSN